MALTDRQECLSYFNPSSTMALLVYLLYGRRCWKKEHDVSYKIRAENWIVKIDLDVHSSSQSRRGGIGGAMPESCLVGIDEVANLIAAALLKSD